MMGGSISWVRELSLTSMGSPLLVCREAVHVVAWLVALEVVGVGVGGRGKGAGCVSNAAGQCVPECVVGGQALDLINR
jgi:hypothetical protein